MLTLAEIEKFAKMLDNEYEKEIIPIIKESQEAIDPILNIIYSSNFEVIRNRCGYGKFMFGYLPHDIQDTIKYLRYYKGTCDSRVKKNTMPPNLISWFGYSPNAYSINDGLMSLFYRADAYRSKPAKIMNDMTNLKKCFNNIKKAYNQFFLENDGEMFKRMTDCVMTHYNTVMKKDKEMDNEFYSLFSSDKIVRKINITITIEKA